MKTIEGFRMRKLGKEHIIVGEGLSQVNFNKMIALNDSAALLWAAVEGGREFTVDQLADLLVDEYDIERELALKDSKDLVSKWIEAGIVSE